MEGALSNRQILLAGATGLVGGTLLQTLLADKSVGQVHVLVRRALKREHPNVRVHVVDFATLETDSNLAKLKGIDEAYLALGTTIKVAGSEQAFRAVDFAANLAVAQLGMRAGAKRLGVVSAAGANSRSRVFYNRVKGELEEALKALPLQALVIAQPSLLIGDRSGLGQPPRFGERIAQAAGHWFAPIIPGQYRPVNAEAVARALAATVPGAQGQVVLASDQLEALGKV